MKRQEYPHDYDTYVPSLVAFYLGANHDDISQKKSDQRHNGVSNYIKSHTDEYIAYVDSPGSDDLAEMIALPFSYGSVPRSVVLTLTPTHTMGHVSQIQLHSDYLRRPHLELISMDKRVTATPSCHIGNGAGNGVK